MRKFLLFALSCISLFALKQDPSIVSGELENGLKYYIKENRLPKDSAHFELIIDSGSTDEAQDESGLAHFVEHMAFNGSRDFSKNELIKQLEKLGVSFGADLNAYTSYDLTAYQLNITINNENLKNAFKVFNNWMDGIEFDPNELEKERGVIIEEERSRNTPSYRLYQQQSKDLFAGSIYLDRAPIGDMNVVRSVDAAKIKAFYHKLYQPRFMKFVAVGDFNATQIQTLIKQNLSEAKNTNDYVHPDKTIRFKNGLNIFNYDASEVGINLIRLSFFDDYSAQIDEAGARRILVNSYISSMLSMLYQQKRTEQNSVLNAGFSRPGLQNKQTMYSFEIKAINGDFDGALKDMLGVIKGVEKYGFSASDFEDAKKNFIKSIEIKFKRSKTKKTSDYADEIVDSLNSGAIILSDKDSRDLGVKLLNEITLNEVNAEFKRILAIPDKRVSVFSAKDYKLDKDKFEQIQKDAVAYDGHMKSENLTQTLIDESLQPKPAVSKEFDERLGIYTVKFENGATLVLKQVKTRENFISFAAVAKGGTSNLKEPRWGTFGVQLANESGVDKYTNYQISKILSGKHISYERRIDALSQGFYGSTGKEDLKTLFGIINLEFNSPRFDEKVLERIKTSQIDALAKRQNLPSYKFNTEFTKFYYNDNPRTKPIQKEDIEALNLQNLRDIVRDKFNGGAFTFILVGDLDVEETQRLAQIYVANLPASKGENFVDDGVRPLSGKQEFRRDYQTTQRSDVLLNMTSRKVEYSRENSLKAQALSNVLATALREKIREDKGETYGFLVGISLNRYPYANSVANISFTCAPQNTQSIVTDIKKIIADIKQKGALEAAHLANYKKAARIGVKKNYDQPEFWARNILSNVLYDQPIWTIDQYEKAIEAVTNDDVKEAARLYLDGTNELLRINDPAKTTKSTAKSGSKTDMKK